MNARVVEFEDLSGADLEVGTVYVGGTAGSIADEPINVLVPVGNQGGIRYSATASHADLVVLYSTLDDEEWPDEIGEPSGTIRYHGDNKDPGSELLAHRGNGLLRRVFARGFLGAQDRLESPVFLVFTKSAERSLPSRSVIFCGVAVPGSDRYAPEDWLVAKFFQHPTGRFENYLVTLSLLDIPVATRAWLDEILAGDVLGPSCPPAYRAWVESGCLNVLRRQI